MFLCLNFLTMLVMNLAVLCHGWKMIPTYIRNRKREIYLTPHTVNIFLSSLDYTQVSFYLVCISHSQPLNDQKKYPEIPRTLAAVMIFFYIHLEHTLKSIIYCDMKASFHAFQHLHHLKYVVRRHKL